jgi:hypothetical protein
MFFLDSNKNRLAVDVINNLIAHCCWMNIHTVAPHGVVFEIRVVDGYGARWTEDGSKVRGQKNNYIFSTRNIDTYSLRC